MEFGRDHQRQDVPHFKFFSAIHNFIQCDANVSDRSSSNSAQILY